MHATARFAPTDSFEYWYRHQDYVPTARRSRWPRSWGEYRHLRYLPPPDVAPIPQTVAQRARLENLYEAIRKRRYYDPDVYERTTKTGRGHDWYVTLIPRPVVEWFSQHSMDDIHNQIAKVVALHVIENRGRYEETIEAALERVHTSYHAAVRERVAAYEARYPALNWDGEYDDEYALDDADGCEPETASDAFFRALQAVAREHLEAGDLPPWLFTAEEVQRPFDGQKSIFFQLRPLPSPPDPWERPYPMPWKTRGQIEPGFGIIGFGLTERDRLRLDGKEPDRTGRIVRIPAARMPTERADTLKRSESDAEAFEFLMYAKSRRDSWAPWRID